MGWYRKKDPAPFDNLPSIDKVKGFYYLDGKLHVMQTQLNLPLEQRKRREFPEIDYKCPFIAFPSGESYRLLESKNPDKEIARVIIFDDPDDSEMQVSLPFKGQRDNVWEQISSTDFCIAVKVGDKHLGIYISSDIPDGNYYLVRYSEEGLLDDIENVGPVGSYDEESYLPRFSRIWEEESNPEIVYILGEKEIRAEERNFLTSFFKFVLAEKLNDHT